MRHEFKPSWTVSPGFYLSSYAISEDLDVPGLAALLGMTQAEVDLMLQNKTRIDEQLARRLEAATGTSAALWIKFDRIYLEENKCE